jgi:alpha-beta hydrolase superfamily lysophospholipase
MNRMSVLAGAALLAAGGLACAADETVQVRTATGTLHGTLDLPAARAPWPVVLIIAGSGPTDRDGNQPQLRNDGLKLLGQALAAKGIAALRYDKRGIGASAAAGPAEPDLRFETYVGDAAECVDWLRRDKRFARVAIIGHSEGSLIGMLAARRVKVEDFVSIAGASRVAPAVIRDQLAGHLPPDLQKRSDEILDALVAGRLVPDVRQELLALYRPSVQPYLISWFKYDPAREIGALDMPVLIVQGTTDLQISTDDARALAAARPGATLRLIESMNHVLKRATTLAEQQAAYTDPSLPLMAEVVDAIVAFLQKASAPHP